MLNNILLMTDSYKVTHAKQYPQGTEFIYSYLEARSGGEYKNVCFFGLQYFLKRYMQGTVVTQKKVDIANTFFKKHFGNEKLFNRDGWEYIISKHNGMLPVEIKAVPEGTHVPEGNVLLTIRNTDTNCWWLTNYLETLLMQSWYPITTATISGEMKKVIYAALKKSGTATPENLAFKLHDFGYRGVSSPESAALGGAAHLVHFQGTDNLAGCEMLMEYYNADMPGFSIPAAEHSTITSWTEAGESDGCENMLIQFPNGFVAVVSDSWNILRAVRSIWGDTLRNKVLERDGVVVIRPDSGDPKIMLPAILEILGERFGFTTNAKGYKVLDPHVRVIQGDGITRHSLAGILDAVMEKGWSADNLAFGSGGGLLQSCNRDTQRMAIKCSEAVIGGVARDVYKQPQSDITKSSKQGQLMLVRSETGELKTVRQGSVSMPDLLVPVFKNGQILVDQTLDEIRSRATSVY